ncbi:MAG: hypothetical protein JM58_04030 [Peptococcaceae bacterium BICA1-8]|nr:MAG: hypothetical protein JM58_04030 [Peptococcaceae bacterium BICA1-8]
MSQPSEKGKGKIRNNQVNGRFQEILQNQMVKTQELKFSKHAQERLSLRNIELNKDAITKLNTAVDKAAEKGAKESLILMGDMAFVVSVKNKTVITALDGENMKANVFTNIDSAVII